MSEEMMNEEMNENLQTDSDDAVRTAVEAIESMDAYVDQLDASFSRVNEGDMYTGTVIGISDTEVTIDLEIYTEGIIKAEELSNDPKFSIHADIQNGDTVKAIVLSADDGQGHILLSKKRADDILAWDSLQELLDNQSVVNVKISGVVNGGVIAYLQGIRGFIPASQLALSYVEDLNVFLNETVDAKVITVDKAKKRLVLSAKAVAKDKAANTRKAAIDAISVGDIYEGKVETITAYGAFVNLGNGISGLVHISQISQKRIQSVNEVLKEGDTVKAKVIAIKEGKISLSMKALQESDPVRELQTETFHYREEGKATTGLGSLLQGLKLDE